MRNAKEYYDRSNRDYVEKYADPGSLTSYRRRRLVDAAIRMATISIDSRVLEVGCGTGLVLQELLRRGIKRVYGTDISRAMIGRLADSVLTNWRIAVVADLSDKPEADVILMVDDLLASKLPPQHFDRILCIEVLRYIDDIDLCFRNVRRALRPGGRFTFTATNLYSFSLFPIRYSLRRHHGRVNPELELLQYFVTDGPLRTKLLQAGFRVVGWERVGFVSRSPLVRPLIRTRWLADILAALDTGLMKVPGVNRLCDTLLVAAETG